MATTERPPSQRGPQYQALDKLDEVLEALREIRGPGPGIDELPEEVGLWLMSGVYRTALPYAGPTQLYIETNAQMLDLGAQVAEYPSGRARPPRCGHLDLMLCASDGMRLWQRRLWFGRAPRIVA